MDSQENEVLHLNIALGAMMWSSPLHGHQGSARCLPGESFLRPTPSAFAGIADTLDAMGRRTSRAVTGLPSGGPETYRYDASGQLVEAAYGSARRVVYGLDAAGNRTAVAENGTATGYVADALNRYVSINGVALAHDGDGNLAGTGLAAFAYDGEGNLRVASAGGAQAQFWRDARGRVVRREIRVGWVTETLELVYDGWELIEEWDAAGGLRQSYVHGQGPDEPLVKIGPGGARHYYHADALGSTVALSDAAGQVAESHAYDAFGAPEMYDAAFNLLPSSLCANRFLFTGREWLPEIGIYDYRHRAYAPELGRFLQPDPIRFNAGDANLYRYCGNDPVARFDPWGLDWWYYSGGGGHASMVVNDPASRTGYSYVSFSGRDAGWNPRNWLGSLHTAGEMTIQSHPRPASGSGLRIRTSHQQDEAFMRAARHLEDNRPHYGVLDSNCADILRLIINYALPSFPSVVRAIETPERLNNDLKSLARDNQDNATPNSCADTGR